MTPVFEEIVKRSIERDFRLPAELGRDAVGIADEGRQVIRTVANRVYSYTDGDASARQ